MEGIIIIGLVINVIISQVVATSVKNREITSSRVFWLSFLFSPIVGMFAALMSPELKEGVVKEQKSAEDRFEEFVSNNLTVILIVLGVVMLATGIYK